jgi:hypothetical protein
MSYAIETIQTPGKLRSTSLRDISRACPPTGNLTPEIMLAKDSLEPALITSILATVVADASAFGEALREPGAGTRRVQYLRPPQRLLFAH